MEDSLNSPCMLAGKRPASRLVMPARLSDLMALLYSEGRKASGKPAGRPWCAHSYPGSIMSFVNYLLLIVKILQGN